MIYKKSWKYILIWENSYWYNNEYYRIKAIKDFSNVKKGDIGGYVKGYRNLSQSGNCWIYEGATVKDNAKVSENAMISGYARAYDNAKVRGESQIYGHAWIADNAIVEGNARVYGTAVVHSNDIIIHGDFN